MSMQIQEGVYIKFVFTGTTLENALNKAVEFGDNEGEVKIATEGTTKFAGVITAVDPGKTTAEEGDNVTVCTEGVIEAYAGNNISYPDALGVGTGGALKAIDVDGTATITNFLKVVGRSMEDAEDGDVFVALLSR